MQGYIEDLIRLIYAKIGPVHAQYFFYPNPYPKNTQRRLRWYAHPITPLIDKLSPYVITRSDTLSYLLAWQSHLEQRGFRTTLRTLDIVYPISLFEKKYQAQGRLCYELTAHDNAAKP